MTKKLLFEKIWLMLCWHIDFVDLVWCMIWNKVSVHLNLLPFEGRLIEFVCHCQLICGKIDGNSWFKNMRFEIFRIVHWFLISGNCRLNSIVPNPPNFSFKKTIQRTRKLIRKVLSNITENFTLKTEWKMSQTIFWANDFFVCVN